MHRVSVSTGTPWEPIVGYSRAVRMRRFVHVSGTTATDSSGDVLGRKDPYTQAVRTIENIAAGLRQAGAARTDVVRTRIYGTNIDDWEAVGRAHGEAFGEIRPATSMVQVSRLIRPEMLVEIEADAICQSG